MSHPQYTPEYLDCLAQRMRNAGGEDLANGIEECAHHWRRTEQEVQRLFDENTGLQSRITEAQRNLQIKLPQVPRQMPA